MRPARKRGIIFQDNPSGCSVVNELPWACRRPFSLPVPLELLIRPPGLVITTERCSFNWRGSCCCIKRHLFVSNKVSWAIEKYDVMVLCYKGPQIEGRLILKGSPLTSSCGRRGDGGAALLLSCTRKRSSSRVLAGAPTAASLRGCPRGCGAGGTALRVLRGELPVIARLWKPLQISLCASPEPCTLRGILKRCLNDRGKGKTLCTQPLSRGRNISLVPVNVGNTWWCDCKC